ncbi:Four-domain proteases inhibitor [Holothuria leucospilota]|uniref:Four-domain proteases inhibitor n=1 Tax=Holothuria leucospilota TaxID=206669 RepID=A0A9Q1CKM0_HOLLE|nr:Four-domain proteases inhibitor [Holothuria leucospilota]
MLRRVPDMDFPVCASNNVTYPSLCEYSVAHCRDNSITYDYAGPCVETTTDPCSVTCSLNMKPVCASNNASYFNRCFLNLAACEDPSIQFVRERQMPIRLPNYHIYGSRGVRWFGRTTHAFHRFSHLLYGNIRRMGESGLGFSCSRSCEK